MIRTITISLSCIAVLLFNACSFSKLAENTKSGKTDPSDSKNLSERIFSSAEIDALKKTTTLFLLKKEDNKEEFEKIINSVWDFNAIRVIHHDEIDALDAGNYSTFVIEGYNTNVQNYVNDVPTISYDNGHLFLTLKHTTEYTNSKGTIRERSTNFSRTELFTDFATMNRMSMSIGVLDEVYMEGKLRNWTPGMIKLYLTDVQDKLKQSKREFLFETVRIAKEIEKLKKDTLFVPDYVLWIYNKKNGKEDARHDVDKLFEKYPYPYKLIPSDELSQKITSGQIEYVFDYVKSSTDNFCRVWSVSKGKIYQKYRPISYNLKPNDLEKIFKE